MKKYGLLPAGACRVPPAFVVLAAWWLAVWAGGLPLQAQTMDDEWPAGQAAPPAATAEPVVRPRADGGFEVVNDVPTPAAGTKPVKPPAPAGDGGDPLSLVAPSSPAGAASDVEAVLSRWREQVALVRDAKSFFMDCEVVVIPLPAAYDHAAKLKAMNAASQPVAKPAAKDFDLPTDRSIIRGCRYVGWDETRVGACVRSDMVIAWQQWLGNDGVSERRKADDSDSIVPPMRSRSLAGVLSWSINPYGRDLILPAWWLAASGSDVKEWRPASAYRILCRQTFMGLPCIVLQYNDGTERGEEWYELRTGRLRRIRVYRPIDPKRPASSPAKPDAVAMPGTVLRDRVFQDFQTLGPNCALPRQAVESIRSTLNNEVIYTLQLTVREMSMNKPLPAWLLDPERKAPK